MRRYQIIEALVLNEVSDDDESFAQVVSEVQRAPGVTLDPIATPHEVWLAIEKLILSGYVKAYILQSHAPHIQIVEGVPDTLDEYWFYQTEQGKSLHASNPWPPGTPGRQRKS